MTETSFTFIQVMGILILWTIIFYLSVESTLGFFNTRNFEDGWVCYYTYATQDNFISDPYPSKYCEGFATEWDRHLTEGYNIEPNTFSIYG